MLTSIQDRSRTNPGFACAPTFFRAGRFGHWLDAALHASLDSVVVVDQAGQVVLANEEAGRLFGWTPRQLVTRRWDSLVPPRLLTSHAALLQRLAHARPRGPRVRCRIDSHGVHSSGFEFAFDALISRTTVKGEPFFLFILRQTRSDGVHTRAEVASPFDSRQRALSSEQAHEVEKRRCSRVLYDDVAQSLSVLKHDFDWLQARLGVKDAEVVRRVEPMQSAFDRIIRRLKHVASTLRPPLLDDFGLHAALHWMATDFHKRTGTLCRVSGQREPVAASDQIESAMFRLVQESLLNVERHAHATQVNIFIWQHPTSLDILIQDDGVGIETGAGDKPGRFGLVAMQERIYTLGGCISISNGEERGVVVRASIPLVRELVAPAQAGLPPRGNKQVTPISATLGSTMSRPTVSTQMSPP